MLDLKDQIQSFIDTGAAPVTAEEVMTRDSPLRGVANERRPSRPHRRIGIYAAIVAVAAVVLAVVGLSIPAGKNNVGVMPASAAAVLESAASEAQAQQPLVPGPGQFLYVRTLVSMTSGPKPSYYVQELKQTWTSSQVQGTTQWQVVGQPQFITGADRTAWEAEGAPPLQSGYGGGGASPYYDVVGLPTDPSKMEAFFASQSDLAPDPYYGRNAVWQFTTAAAFLQNGASALQRSALLRFMATIPGVELAGQATTVGTDRSGTVLAIPSDFSGLSVQVILDTQTSDLLEMRYVVTDSALYAKATPGFQGEVLAAGQVRNYVDFLYAGIATSSSSLPSEAPTLPANWPFGTTQEPLPGSLYP